MSTAEDSPALQSMSIRAFVHHLEEVHHESPTTSLLTKKAASPTVLLLRETENGDGGSETVLPPSLADIQPRPLSSLTILSRSTLTTDLDQQEVLERIEKLIRAKSLDYTVDLETASVECQTPCSLSFALYFWKNDQGKVLVEIQRRNGCAILMHRVRKTLFRALLRDASAPLSTTREELSPSSTSWLQRCPLNMTVSPRVKQMMDQDEQEKQQESQLLQESLEICEEQLCSERRDLHQLAMESLVHLTDPQECSSTTAETVAQALLNEDMNGQDSHLHFEFVDTLRSSTRHRRRESFKYDYSGEAPIQEGQHDKTMAILSLTALYNAIKVAKSCDCCSIDMSSHSWRRIAASLKESLCDPVRHVQDATIAARCIRLMEEVDQRTSNFFADEEPLVGHLMGETAATIRHSNNIHASLGMSNRSH